MHVEVVARQNLEEGFAIEVYFGEVLILLVIQIRIRESIIKDRLPFRNDQPFCLVIL